MVGRGGRVRGSSWGVRVDVNEELKFFLENSHKKIRVGGSGDVGQLGRSGWWGGQGGCERNVGGRGWSGVWGM